MKHKKAFKNFKGFFSFPFFFSFLIKSSTLFNLYCSGFWEILVFQETGFWIKIFLHMPLSKTCIPLCLCRYGASERAKLHDLHTNALYVFTCLHVLLAYLPLYLTCLCAFASYVLTRVFILYEHKCLYAIAFYLRTCLHAFVFYLALCLKREDF